MRAMTKSAVALKEWAVVVEALARGEQMILVRKGGIRDPKGCFQLQHREFFLYPTWEHQNEVAAKAIRPEFQERFRVLLTQPANSATVPLRVYAGVGYIGEVRDPKQLAGLERYHIWTPEFFEERMRYRPQAPTLVVALRAYRLKQPMEHPVKPEYAGCKSWVPLGEELVVEDPEPVVENRRFRAALEEITAHLS
jgi:hypothetical protein